MTLSALTFTPSEQVWQMSGSRKPFFSVRELVFADLSKLWHKLQFKDRFRDSGERSQKINKKELAKQRKKHEGNPKAIQAFENKVVELTEIYIGLNKKGYEEFINQSYALIDKKYSQDSSIYLQANQQLTAFVEDKNKKTRLKHGYYPSPVAIKASATKQNPSRINNDWVKQGKKISHIIDFVLKHWQKTNFYKSVNDSEQSQQAIIGWLAFSGIVFGGINDRLVLLGWLKTLLNGELKPFIDYRVIANIH